MSYSLPIVMPTVRDGLDWARRRRVSVAAAIAKPFDLSDLSLQLATLLRWPT